ncbi:MAG: SRPBCC family protein [Mucilaginibacter polytrichastri]|nr:SRPBCC family protein [Mucilaginibacter polytrichastri]
MKILVNILLVVLAIVALVLIAGLFMNKKMAVVRSVTINKPLSEVYAYTSLLKNQNNYSVWAKRDPNMKKEFHGVDGTVGFVSAWESKQKDVGKGEQTIVRVIPNELIDYSLHFIEPFESTNHAYMTFKETSAQQTEVNWGFDGEMNYPMNVMLPFMNMDKSLGKDFQDGLNNLKAILEKQ